MSCVNNLQLGAADSPTYEQSQNTHVLHVFREELTALNLAAVECGYSLLDDLERNSCRKARQLCRR